MKHVTVRSISAIAILVLTVVVPAPAQDAQVVYLEGDVELFDGGRWQLVDIGDALPSQARLRLADGAYLEVVQGRSTLRFNEVGEVTLAHRGDSGRGSTDTDVRGLLGNKIQRLTTPRENVSESATSAGVRASEAATEPEVDWAGDETPEELIEEGLALLSDGAVEDASFAFEDAYDFATGDTITEAGFFFAYSLYLLEETDFAIEILDEVDPAPDAPFYADYALLVGELYPSVGRADDAAALLTGLLSARSDLATTDPLTAQAAYFLLARAYETSGDGDPEAAYRRAAALAPGTALAEAARTAVD